MSQIENPGVEEKKSLNDHPPLENDHPPIEQLEDNPECAVVQEESEAAEAEVEAEVESSKSHEEVDRLTAELEKESDPERKLQIAIHFMETALSQSGSPHFKSFWQVRTICLLLFKENISPSVRASLWNQYTELSKEARRLKEILDEQSAFAVEQIEMAIQALESDIEKTENTRENPPTFQLPIACKALEEHVAFYQKAQQELDLLNNQASRINGLRKELIKTEMKVRQKNKFFQRLSLAGDRVFPRRKDLIKEVSQTFGSDVDAFIAQNFSEESVSDSLFILREEIKALQATAKVLTLNTQSFTYTRTRLSESWDKLKQLEKERKKERAHQKVLFKENTDAVLKLIEEFSQAVQAKALSNEDGNKKVDEIVRFMRNVELGRDELKLLRDRLSEARKLFSDQVHSEERERQSQENERQLAKKQKMLDLKQSVDALLLAAEQYGLDQLITERDALLEKINASSLVKSEKQELERLLKSLRDVISDKKEQALMSLSDDDRQALQQLREVLVQRKERRQEIKKQLELLRKSSGNSGFDFEQAMVYNAQLNEEKERLEKITQGIEEVEEKISKLQKRV